ncbi:Bug family tripartite tricarboxylate transporter substrate binding protein [Acidovorax sp. SUPP950]|uniref:Bug family tripartite tricarboxylate transporter substrate binding protein n=1 Tax=unclassified Acidovorax TaxID=2684926 RepID=UPI0023C054DB|nr:MULTISPECIES: Bug family tripartite tricarboxylate transporter substrate binding protein [Comamonadaceae]WOI44306.1 Bug family tripartite tricarboxylate transporter substrate binding protein [Paracidovorax avenae]GKS75145.1 Bug family tripartite tricarboxylate transporter substrate binding protein [Acidovorax sp. SUPP950]GKS84179.1 Bug family tripartite tricarboxylate transporter substrate binding protein [Acidovorax sp. SUPP1855]
MTKMNRRQAGLALAGLAAAGLGAPARAQQGVPRILVGFPAGGSIDVVARRLAEQWRGRTGTTTVVEQKVGAGGRIALATLKDAPPDGLTLVLSPSSMLTIYPHVYKRLQYRPATDFIAVTPVALSTCGFMVGPKVPESVKTLRQFADWTKARTEPEGYASPAAGAMPHFLGTQFARAAGIQLTHVPYRGAAPGLQDLMGGQVASGCFSVGDCLPHLPTGRVRVLGVTDTRRSRFLPDVATFEEQGFAGIHGVESYGLYLPAKTPAAQVDRLLALAQQAIRDPAVVESLAKLGFEPVSSTPEEFARQLAQERERWAPVVAASGFSSEE